MIETITSTVDQRAASTLSNVGSVEVDMTRRERRRRIDTIHTLHKEISIHQQCVRKLETHNPPNPKMTIRNSFCLRGIVSVFKILIGRIKIIISVAMFSEAFVNHRISISRHFPPGIDLSQKNAMGPQMKIEVRIV